MEMESCSYMLSLVASCFFFLCSFCHALLATRRSGNVCCGSRHHAPRSHPVLGCLVEFYRNRHRLLDWYTGLLAASPSQTVVVERLGARRTVVTANPVNVEHILKAKFGNYPKGKPFTEVLGDLLGGGIFNVDGEQWRAQRKLVSHEFTARALREQVGAALEAEARARLVPALDAAAATGGEVDVQELLRQFAFNVICRVSLGADPGEEMALPLSRLAAAFDAAAAIIARRGAAPVAAVWKAKRALGVGSERRLREEVEVIYDTITELIRGRRRKRPARRAGDDLVSRMAAAGYGDEAIRDMVISFIMAGRDTTSSALTWFFWLMTRHRDVEDEVLGEIESRTCGHDSGDGVVVGLDLDGSRKMHVLHAALCETMRLYPPVAWDSKHAAEADVLPDGTRVERGDRVTYFPYGMGRMETIWGADASEFRPRRWLQALAQDESVSPFKFPVFQGGPRTCLGKEMAFLQMKFVVSAMLRRFELRAVDENRSPVFVPLLTAHMAGGLKVTVRRRRHQNGACERAMK
ncbi:Cytochrome P450 94B3 [Dichanthelium oligosanthes]|uniref:Cytochrome P450 94B3 n=1 Tax=Dichanthelium oligosanthes TaxID=888268 RepID=A0A1E5VQU8_9POAL|nr:Cytochrome P450 94B3 [Dichanthelium oligosanthes]